MGRSSSRCPGRPKNFRAEQRFFFLFKLANAEGKRRLHSPSQLIAKPSRTRDTYHGEEVLARARRKGEGHRKAGAAEKGLGGLVDKADTYLRYSKAKAREATPEEREATDVAGGIMLMLVAVGPLIYYYFFGSAASGPPPPPSVFSNLNM